MLNACVEICFIFIFKLVISLLNASTGVTTWLSLWGVSYLYQVEWRLTHPSVLPQRWGFPSDGYFTPLMFSTCPVFENETKSFPPSGFLTDVPDCYPSLGIKLGHFSTNPFYSRKPCVQQETCWIFCLLFVHKLTRPVPLSSAQCDIP